MKTANVILIIVGILVLSGVAYLIYQSNKKAKIQEAAKAVGVPDSVAKVISESSDPAAAARSIGVPPAIAESIGQGVTINPAVLTSGLTKLGTGSFYNCPKGTSVRVETGETDNNGNKLYNCFGTPPSNA